MRFATLPPHVTSPYCHSAARAFCSTDQWQKAVLANGRTTMFANGRNCFGVVLGIALIAGCSKSNPSEPGSSKADTPDSKPAAVAPQAAAPQLDPKMQAIANAAADFLDAMLKG